MRLWLGILQVTFTIHQPTTARELASIVIRVRSPTAHYTFPQIFFSSTYHKCNNNPKEKGERVWGEVTSSDRYEFGDDSHQTRKISFQAHHAFPFPFPVAQEQKKEHCMLCLMIITRIVLLEYSFIIVFWTFIILSLLLALCVYIWRNTKDFLLFYTDIFMWFV